MPNVFKKIFKKNQNKLYNIQGDNNKIIVVKKDNTEYLLDLNKETYSGLIVEIYGNNNTIKIHEPFVCNGTRINIGTTILPNHNAILEFGSTGNFTENIIHISFGSWQRLKIGKDTTMYKSSISLPENAIVEIGEDCMFASGICIRGADGHAVFDAKTGEILNKDITTTKIGNHCWIGRGVTILKKANIPDNSVVAEGSVVTKNFTEARNNSEGFVGGVVIAGNPAQIKKEGINWSRKSPTFYRNNNINPLDEIKK